MRTFRIVDVRATTVAVPLKAALRHSNGCDWGRFVRTVVEVGTDQGLIGLGERFLTKGPGLYLEGQLQACKWTDQGPRAFHDRGRGAALPWRAHASGRRARGRPDRDRIARGFRR
jgi:hypothetical protein